MSKTQLGIWEDCSTDRGKKPHASKTPAVTAWEWVSQESQHVTGTFLFCSKEFSFNIANAVSIYAKYYMELEVSTALQDCSYYSTRNAWATSRVLPCLYGNVFRRLCCLKVTESVWLWPLSPFPWCDLFCGKCLGEDKSLHAVSYHRPAAPWNTLHKVAANLLFLCKSNVEDCY